MDPLAVLAPLNLAGAGFAAPVGGSNGAGFRADDLVTPASGRKIQVALTVENAIAAGSLDGAARRSMSPERRTPGPVGISLMRDDVSMSVRDLVVAMLTISDNVATDGLTDIVGLDQISETTRALGMAHTRITSNLRDMLDALARDAGSQAAPLSKPTLRRRRFTI